jgi:gluconokinase
MHIEGLILMGVSGCGKSTVAAELAERLGWELLEADDFHPPENIAKMKAGIPLNDADRAPWLSALHAKLVSTLKAGRHPVLACSALKASYRQALTRGLAGLQFVYLKGDYDLIWSRISKRRGHFMQADLLRSQFAALEEPLEALVVDVGQTPDEIVAQIVKAFRL